LSLGDSLQYAEFLEGDGTAGNPYKVASKAAFLQIPIVGGATNFVQTANIDLQGDPGLSGPYYSYSLYGNYDGGHFAILNGMKPLFDQCSGYVYNLQLSNFNVHESTSTLGTICNRVNGGYIQDVRVLASSVRNDVASSSMTGGLVGQMSGGAIRLAEFSGDVFAPSPYALGGLVGQMDGGIIDTSVISAGARVNPATGNSSGSVGGFVGILAGGTVSTSFSRASVNKGANVGGFAGEIRAGTVQQCFAQGPVAHGFSATGGFVGLTTSSAVIQENFSSGTVLGDSGYTGGFVGSVNGGSYAYNLTVSSSTTGGILGAFAGQVLGGTALSSNVFYNYSNLAANGAYAVASPSLSTFASYGPITSHSPPWRGRASGHPVLLWTCTNLNTAGDRPSLAAGFTCQ
jgi:hypothetical protein